MEADFGSRLDYLTNEMCQMNTRVGHIARRQARMASLTPSPEASTDDVDDEEDDASSSCDDEEDDASSSCDDEMMTSQ